MVNRSVCRPCKTVHCYRSKTACNECTFTVHQLYGKWVTVIHFRPIRQLVITREQRNVIGHGSGKFCCQRRISIRREIWRQILCVCVRVMLST